MVHDLEVRLTLHVNTPNLLDLKRRARLGGASATPDRSQRHNSFMQDRVAFGCWWAVYQRSSGRIK